MPLAEIAQRGATGGGSRWLSLRSLARTKLARAPLQEGLHGSKIASIRKVPMARANSPQPREAAPSCQGLSGVRYAVPPRRKFARTPDEAETRKILRQQR